MKKQHTTGAAPETETPQAPQPETAAATAINTLSMDTGMGGKLTKSFYQLRARKIFQVPSLPTAAQSKGDHLQVRFEGRYVSRTMGWDEMSKLDWAGYKLAYEQAKAAGTVSPSYSGSGEPYVALTVTPEANDHGDVTGGTLSLNGIVMLTFELNPDVNLDPPVKPSGVYHEGHPDTGDGDGEDEDEDNDDADGDDGDGDDDDDDL